MWESPNTCQYNPENTFRALDIILPPELTGEVISETHRELLYCQLDLLIRPAQWETSVSEDLLLSCIKMQLLDFIQSWKNIQDAFTSELFQKAFFSLWEWEYKLLVEEIERWNVLPVIIVNQVAINYSAYLLPENTIWRSVRPPERPDFPPEYLRLIEESRVNQYEILKNTWLSRSMRNFLQVDFIPRILWEDIPVTEDHLERIRTFLCFLIDIETSGGVNLINGVSTATWYTQTLNEENSNRSVWEYNSIDTRLRTALMFYNNGNITPGSRNDTLNIPESLPRAQWIADLWEYNAQARNMNAFSFDSELRLTLIYLATQNPDAMKNILTGSESQQAEAAQLLYHTHHTNVAWQKNTHMVMMQKILLHYG